MPPIPQRVHYVLRSSVFPLQKPHVIDPQLGARRARFLLANIGQRRPMFPRVVIPAASAARGIYHRYSLVLVVNGARQVRCHTAFVIRMRNHYQNVRFKSLVRPFHHLGRRRRRLPPRRNPHQLNHARRKNHQPSLHPTSSQSPNSSHNKEKIVPAPSRNSLDVTPTIALSARL